MGRRCGKSPPPAIPHRAGRPRRVSPFQGLRLSSTETQASPRPVGPRSAWAFDFRALGAAQTADAHGSQPTVDALGSCRVPRSESVRLSLPTSLCHPTFNDNASPGPRVLSFPSGAPADGRVHVRLRDRQSVQDARDRREETAEARPFTCRRLSPTDTGHHSSRAPPRQSSGEVRSTIPMMPARIMRGSSARLAALTLIHLNAGSRKHSAILREISTRRDAPTCPRCPANSAFGRR